MDRAGMGSGMGRVPTVDALTQAQRETRAERGAEDGGAQHPGRHAPVKNPKED